MAKLIEKSDASIQGAPSQVGGGSSGSDFAQRTRDRTTRPSYTRSKSNVKGVTGACVDPRKPRRLRRTLLVLASLMCLVLILIQTYAGVASAQEKTSEESLVEGMVANLNAYWEEQFRLLGHPYSPAELVFLYDHELFLGPCGLAFTGLGPGYCPYDETLYYPVDWVDPATGLRLEEYGEPAVEMVVAHETAHHAQSQMEKFGIPGVESVPGTYMELEADCLAGVYANRAITEPGDIEAALAALGEAGGPGHGTSQQRVAAFELGYNTGDQARCLALGDGGGTATEGDGSKII
jgi:Putative neutral zinc metallopeptidase